MRFIVVLLLSATTACAQESRLWAPLKTYSDPARGVSFQYPASWEAATQFGYNPGALSTDETKLVAGFGFVIEQGQGKRIDIVDGNAFVEGFGIVYSAVPANNATACDGVARKLLDDQPSGKTKHVKFGGITYATYDGSQAGMNQPTEGTLYATFRRGTCFLFETDEATVTMAVFDEDDVSTRTAVAIKPSRSISTHLLDVMKSVRIR